MLIQTSLKPKNSMKIGIAKEGFFNFCVSFSSSEANTIPGYVVSENDYLRSFETLRDCFLHELD